MGYNDRFDENYALGSTQSLKNKDIPEGGAKGTILPSCVFFCLNNILCFSIHCLLASMRTRGSALKNMSM